MKVKKSAVAGEYSVTQLESDTIKVYRTYDNTKAALREIAESEGFDFDPEWNTRTFGAKLIDYLNSK